MISLDNTAAGNASRVVTYYDDNDDWWGFMVKAEKGDSEQGVHTIPGDIPLETWIHVTGTYDGNQAKVYVDGKLDHGWKVGGKVVKGDLLLAIGDRTDG
jgi:hypothetical protein